MLRISRLMLVLLYINSTSIHPIMIMNRMYGNKNLLCIAPLITHTIVVCFNNISSMAVGCFV
jgi:hypothetical protein